MFTKHQLSSWQLQQSQQCLQQHELRTVSLNGH